MSGTGTGDAPVAHAVRLSPAATASAVAEYDRLLQTAGAEAAEDWREGLLAAWAGLATLPLRCPVALEDEAFQDFCPGPPLHVFLYRLSGRKSAWRLLFTVHPETADDPPTVQVHLIRHSAQAPMTVWPQDEGEV